MLSRLNIIPLCSFHRFGNRHRLYRYTDDQIADVFFVTCKTAGVEFFSHGRVTGALFLVLV